MNWYKKSQEVETYTDIGHYNSLLDNKSDSQGYKKPIALWVSDLTGNNFEIQFISQYAEHSQFFDIEYDKNFWGRYDPFKDKVSVMLPYLPNTIVPIETKDIPNRLIRKLQKEFPTATMYAFPYNE